MDRFCFKRSPILFNLMSETFQFKIQRRHEITDFVELGVYSIELVAHKYK